jgi:hypothetical protein
MTQIIHRLRIRNAAGTADALVVTSQRGGANPYLKAAPTGDGVTCDDLTGKTTAASYSGIVVDGITGGTSRLFTSQLEDAGGQLQIGDRRAAWEQSVDGGATYETLVAGFLMRYQLTSDVEWSVTVGDPTRVEHAVTAFAPRSALVVVSAPGALIGATTIPCAALKVGMPKGTFLNFGNAFAAVTAAAPAGAVTIAVAAIQWNLNAGDQATYANRSHRSSRAGRIAAASSAVR